MEGGLSGPQMTATGVGSTESSCQGRDTVAKQRGERRNPVAFLWLLYAAHCAAERGNEGKETGREGRKAVCERELGE